MLLWKDMDTPILLLPFNRPTIIAEVIDALRVVKPKRIFVVADGPRSNRPGEAELCEKTRKTVLEKLDWGCEVTTLFRNENLGVGRGIDEAITWFFEHVDQGIILEDDCVPNPSFFDFCNEMLKRYKDDEHVGVISGNNFISPATLTEIDPEAVKYYFVRPTYTWGWATWKRAWDKHDLTMTSWPEHHANKFLQKTFKNKNVADFFDHSFEYAYKKRSAWDTPWFFTCLINGMLSITPPRNLISNIGVFGAHESSSNDSLNNLKTEAIDIAALKHPDIIAPNEKIENLIFRDIKIDIFSPRRALVKTLSTLGLHAVVRKAYRKFNFKF
jgi:hypothetical protein